MSSWFPRGEFPASEKSVQKALARAERAINGIAKGATGVPCAWGRVHNRGNPGFSVHAMRKTATRLPWMVVHFAFHGHPRGVVCTYRTRYSVISLLLLLGVSVVFLAFPLQVAGTSVFGWHLSFAWWEYVVAVVSPLVWLWLVQDGRKDARRVVTEFQRRLGENSDAG
ncbi:MAG: hypothetical protein BWY06_01548 [Candidatus Latescibacteria bacterium ADurb.Bin168]|nr:MAG: hypothetical protein BWY06_01548 [Candidatus Latescibacteria bacterium ADurb.Bin168]